jgi:hypothetical protein
MLEKLTTSARHFIGELWQMAKRHVVLTWVLSLLCLIFAGFSFYIGFVQMTVLLGPVGAIAWWMLKRRERKGGTQAGTAEAIAVCSCIAIAAVVTFVGIQAIPYGRAHSNGTVTGEPQWDSPRTRELVVRACYGCHSNEVEYPSYANVAPISWAVQSHVDEGRGAVNFSEFATSPRRARASLRAVRSGFMAPAYYTRFGRHPEARLTDAEMQELIAGLEATPGLHQ